jgi:hypothetical protein
VLFPEAVIVHKDNTDPMVVCASAPIMTPRIIRCCGRSR